MDIPAYTFEIATTVIVELFCTPKSSTENPSLSVSGHLNCMNRIFFVEDYAEDEFGLWAKDEVAGEQGYVDDERSCFWTWDDTECVWQSRPFKGRQMKRRSGRGTGKGKGRFKRTGRAFFGDEQTQDTEWRQEEDPVWWSKGNKGKKGLSKDNDGFQKGGFRPYQPDKGAGKDFHQNKGRGKDHKGKGKEGTFHQSGFSASETPNKEGYGQAWESDDWSASHWSDDSWSPDAGWFCTRTYTAWMVAPPMNLANHPTHVVLDFGCTRSIGSRAAIERFKRHA